VLSNMPAILPILDQPHLEFKWNALSQSLQTFVLRPLDIVGMARSRIESIHRLAEAESRLIQKHLVRVEHCTIRCQDSDWIGNRIGDREKFLLTLFQLLLGALPVIDVSCRSVPADDPAAFVF